MKISLLKLGNFVGIDEFTFNPNSNINIIKGPTGIGKTTITEAIEKAFSNVGRRTELVKKGENEALLYIETDEGLEIERRIREGSKANYFKLRQRGQGINSTEAELKKLIRGDIFRPLDFINLPIKDQTDIILSMIKMDYSSEQIIEWFLNDQDILNGINTDKHLLQILKDIENKFYKEREEVNRDIKSLEIQVKNIERGLPDNYNGEEWRSKDVKAYYDKVSEAERINKFIKEAENLKANFDNKVDSIKADEETKKAKLDVKYTENRQDLKDLIELSKQKIEKLNNEIEGMGTLLDNQLKDYDNELEKEIAELKEKYSKLKEEAKNKIVNAKEICKEDIIQQQQKIAVKEQELSDLDNKKELEKESIEKETLQLIEIEKEKIGKASEYLENNQLVDIEPIRAEADKIVEMREYLRDWDKMLDIRNGELANKKAHSDYLTNIITIARNKPSELLKIHKLPFDGLSVDENGLIRRNNILLDGLSDGQKLDTAFEIALQRMGELKVMCIDGYEKLDDDYQQKIVNICVENDIQAFITVTESTQSGQIEITDSL